MSKLCIPIKTKPISQNEGKYYQVPHLPRKMEVDIAKCHACHTKIPRRHGAQARHQSQLNPISATPDMCDKVKY